MFSGACEAAQGAMPLSSMSRFLPWETLAIERLFFSLDINNLINTPSMCFVVYFSWDKINAFPWISAPGT